MASRRLRRSGHEGIHEAPIFAGRFRAPPDLLLYPRPPPPCLFSIENKPALRRIIRVSGKMQNMSFPAFSSVHSIARCVDAPRGPGLYIIGEKKDADRDFGPVVVNEGRIGGSPENFVPLYAGRSRSIVGGIRARLQCHFRGQGNRGVRCAIQNDRALFSFSRKGRSPPVSRHCTCSGRRCLSGFRSTNAMRQRAICERSRDPEVGTLGIDERGRLCGKPGCCPARTANLIFCR